MRFPVKTLDFFLMTQRRFSIPKVEIESVPGVHYSKSNLSSNSVLPGTVIGMTEFSTGTKYGILEFFYLYSIQGVPNNTKTHEQTRTHMQENTKS